MKATTQSHNASRKWPPTPPRPRAPPPRRSPAGGLGDRDTGIGVDIDMDIDSDMAVSRKSGSFKKCLGLWYMEIM